MCNKHNFYEDVDSLKVGQVLSNSKIRASVVRILPVYFQENENKQKYGQMSNNRLLEKNGASCKEGPLKTKLNLNCCYF